MHFKFCAILDSGSATHSPALLQFHSSRSHPNFSCLHPIANKLWRFHSSDQQHDHPDLSHNHHSLGFFSGLLVGLPAVPLLSIASLLLFISQTVTFFAAQPFRWLSISEYKSFAPSLTPYLTTLTFAHSASDTPASFMYFKADKQSFPRTFARALPSIWFQIAASALPSFWSLLKWNQAREVFPDHST